MCFNGYEVCYLIVLCCETEPVRTMSRLPATWDILPLFGESLVFQAQPSTRACGRKVTAFLPGVDVCPGGSAVFLGTSDWFQVSHMSLVVLWQRGPHSSVLERLHPILELYPWICDLVAHPRLFCFHFLVPLEPYVWSGLLWGWAFGGGLSAVFWNPLYMGGKQHCLPQTGLQWNFITGSLFEKFISCIVKS